MKNITDFISGLNDVDPDSLPDISELGDGVYRAKWWCWVFELEDGRKFRPHLGVKCSRRFARWDCYDVRGGEIFRRAWQKENGGKPAV